MAQKRKRKIKSAPGGEVAGSLPVPPPASPPEGSPPARDEHGRWLPGVSGNPAGKIKGMRNRLTLERIALEGALREYIAEPKRLEKLKKAIDRILDIAVSGEDKQAVQAFKVIADKVMTAPKDTTDGEQQVPNQVMVVIENLTTKRDEKPAVTVEYEEIENSRS